eukprot:1368446-Amphidinium_carterae.1
MLALAVKVAYALTLATVLWLHVRITCMKLAREKPFWPNMGGQIPRQPRQQSSEDTGLLQGCVHGGRDNRPQCIQRRMARKRKGKFTQRR